MWSFSDPSTDTDPGLFWGMVVYDKAKVAVNTPAVFTEVGLNWLMIREITPGTAPTSFQNTGFTDYLFGGEFDVKAKRKLPNLGESLYMCLYNGGSATVTYTVYARTLVALP
jgi:hypothetical protein